MIIDVCSYNGEVDLFRLRYKILAPYVDEFIVVEFDKTFSGRDKPFYGKELDESFSDWQDKIRYNYVTESTYGKYQALAESSPNTKGAAHWTREFKMKESIKDCLTHLKDEDTVFIGDCDEIWDATMPHKAPEKLKLRVYTYYLNNRSSEQFWGTIVAKYKDIKDECLNHMRTNLPKTEEYRGWHFTSMGGHKAVERKLTDSYTEDSYANEVVMENLEHNIVSNKDFLGRNFTYKTDESQWPVYLKEHREEYNHLIK